MTESKRHVVVATDEKFVIPTAVTLRSLSLSGSGTLCVWILASGVSPASRRLVEQSVAGHEMSLEWIEMDSAELGDTSRSQIGKATYFRLGIGELLPSTVDRALYMDSDMLVAGTLAPLWSKSFESEVLYAVRSVHYPSICTYGAMDNWPQLGLDPRAPYFNAGLMMINLTEWRTRNVGRRCLDYLASPLANGALADQEALNAVIAGSWVELEPKWNQQTPLLAHNRGAELLYASDVLREARESPAVIHFLSRPKPWQVGCTHMARERWLKMAEETAFAPVRLQSESFRTRAGWRVRRAASALVKGL